MADEPEAIEQDPAPVAPRRGAADKARMRGTGVRRPVKKVSRSYRRPRRPSAGGRYVLGDDGEPKKV